MTRMRPTKRRKTRRVGDPDIDIAAFYKEMLTGKYPAIPAPTYQDVEKWARARRELQ